MPNEDDINDSESINSAIEAISDSASDIVSGIPAPVKKNFFKAVNQLCTSLVEIPAAYLEGKAREMRAETQARVNIIETGSKKIAEQMEVNPAYAKIAVEKHCKKIIRERVNLDSIAKIAADELKTKEKIESESNGEQDEIRVDWLNSFEQIACQKSSEEMKLLFENNLKDTIEKELSELGIAYITMDLKGYRTGSMNEILKDI